VLPSLLAVSWLTAVSPAAAEPPAPDAVPSPSSSSAAEPATTSAEASRPTAPAPATTSPATPEAARPTVPAPPRPPPLERGHHLEPPGTVEEYDAAFERLTREAKSTTGEHQAIALADLAKVERWYAEDVHRNGGTLAVGIVLLAAHPALLVGGGMAALDGEVWSTSGRNASAAQVAAFPLLIGGLIALGAGVALTVSGAARRVRPPSEREDSPSRRAAAPSSPVALTFGPGVLAGAF